VIRYKFVPLSDYREYPPEEMLRRSAGFHRDMERRRSVRAFSARPVSREVIDNCIAAAGTAPSGANRQPWHFVVVSDAEAKKRIRKGAEAEEREFYARRAPEPWLGALEPLGTDARKPFLETAPYLIVIFAEHFARGSGGDKTRNYYVTESVGIASGLLIAAVHHAGLVSLTHTPSPMRFLNEILGRPANERPYMILVVGYPEEDVVVPDISRKPFDEIVTHV